jgi:hypothetical protein
VESPEKSFDVISPPPVGLTFTVSVGPPQAVAMSGAARNAPPSRNSEKSDIKSTRLNLYLLPIMIDLLWIYAFEKYARVIVIIY